MNIKSKVSLLSLSLLLLCSSFLSPQEQGKQNEAYEEIVIYDGDLSASPVRLSLGQWGTGLIEEVEEAGYVPKAKVLRLTLYSLVEGGCFIFGKPIEITGGQSSLYLVMWVKFAGAPTQRAPEEATPYGGGVGFGGVEQQQLPSTQPGFVPGAVVQQRGVEHNLNSLRIVFDFGKGWSELNFKVPFEMLVADTQGWIRMPIPLVNARGLPIEKGLKLHRLFIGADKADELLIKKMVLARDETPLSVRIKSSWREEYDFDISREIEKVRHLPKVFIGPFGMPIDFIAEVDEGASITEVLWDFNKEDGVNWEKPDAKGNVVRYFFQKPGTYIITIAVRDKFGLKQPLTVERKVKVLK